MSLSLRTVSLTDFTSPDPKAREAIVAELGAGLRELGFVSVAGAALPEGLVDATYAAIRDFFALPLEAKRACELPASNGNRGYVTFGMEHAKDRKVSDLKEFFHVGRELPELGDGGKNAFPAELPQFRETTTRLYEALDAVARELLVALALHFGERGDTIADMARGGNSILRLIHYPRLQDLYVPGAVRAAEHEDINLITLLPEATASGLEILTRDGRWLLVATPNGHLVVDSGDMLARITGGLVPATTHRVVNPPGEKSREPRFSVPYFLHPNPDFLIDVLPGCVSADNPSRYPTPITSHDYLLERLREIKLI